MSGFSRDKRSTSTKLFPKANIWRSNESVWYQPTPCFPSPYLGSTWLVPKHQRFINCPYPFEIQMWNYSTKFEDLELFFNLIAHCLDLSIVWARFQSLFFPSRLIFEFLSFNFHLFHLNQFVNLIEKNLILI